MSDRNRNPLGIGGAKPGESRNPSGLSKEQAEAKRIMGEWLRSPENVSVFQKAYRKAVEDGNATIITDYANRLMGKVKDELEAKIEGSGLSDEETATLKAFMAKFAPKK